MEKQIFRKKSMERVSSPEQLNDYIRVSNPSLWMTIAAIIVLLAGACMWGIFGQLETKVRVAAKAEENAIICYVKESEIDRIADGMTVEIGEGTFIVAEIPAEPVKMDDSDAYLLHIGGLQAGEWVYKIKLDGTLAAGAYAADIIVESVSPLSFVFN